MKTIRVYHLNNLSPSLFHRLKEAQMEAAHGWNLCMETHKDARMAHAPWPGRNELQRMTKGRYARPRQSVQMVVHAFLANIETTRKLRKEHPEMRMKYPWRIKTFYPVHWPAQAVSIEKGRVVLPLGKGRPSLVLPVQLPENAGACTLVWNRGFELHVCVEVPQAEASPGAVQATVDLGEIQPFRRDHHHGQGAHRDRTRYPLPQTPASKADGTIHQEAEPLPETLPALEEAPEGEEQNLPKGRAARA
jgi:putative transposase